jgi:hypothetical protein
MGRRKGLSMTLMQELRATRAARKRIYELINDEIQAISEKWEPEIIKNKEFENQILEQLIQERKGAK